MKGRPRVSSIQIGNSSRHRHGFVTEAIHLKAYLQALGVLLLALLCASAAWTQPTITSPNNMGTYSIGPVQIPLQASGGTAPYTWSITGGALPNGLVLRTDPASFLGTATAAIVGVATTPVNIANNFTLTVTDAQSRSASQATTLRISALTVTDGSLPDGAVGVPYSYTLSTSGASGAVAWAVQSGNTLPAGYILNSATGQITGTPTTAAIGNLGFSVTATDTSGTINRFLSINTNGVGFSTAADLGNTTVGATFSAQIQGTGGAGPYSYSGSGFPPGLSISSSGAITGTVGNASGTYQPYITVTDSTTRSYSRNFVLNVFGSYSLASINGPVPPDDATLGTPITYSFNGYGGRSSYTWGVTGTLPTGMTLKTTGPLNASLSGVPTQTGTFTVAITLTDGSTPAITVSTPFTFSVKAVSSDYPNNGTRGQAYSFYLRPIGGVPSFTWTLLSGTLPTGLTLNSSTGIISGTPTDTGSFSARISIAQPSGSSLPTFTRTYFFFINSPISPTISFSGIPTDGVVNRSYSYFMSFCCGTGTLSYAVTSGTLPAGLSLSPSTGQISGTPTTAGVSTFTVTVTDSANSSNIGVRTVSINISPLSVVYPNLTVTSGTSFTGTFTATGGTGALTWTLDPTSQLPTGLTLGTNGSVTGTTTFVGSFSFGFIVTDSAGRTFHGFASLTVGSTTVVITQSSNLGTFQMGVINQPISAIGGTSSEVWSITAGALPAGLSLRNDIQNNETISGVPTATGNFSFTVSVNSAGAVTAQAFTMRISPIVVMDQTYVPDGFVGVVYSGYTLTATGGAAPLTWTATSGLPTGMALSSAGVLSGTPAAAGFYNIFFTVTDGVDTISRSISFNVSKIQITSAALLPTATQGTAYSTTLTSSGGTGTITWTANGLPSGLTVNASTGVISGTPSTSAGVGTYNISVTATDSTSTFYTKYTQMDLVGLTPRLVQLIDGFGTDCTIGMYCSRTVSQQTGGVAPFTWTVTGLPTGMSFRTGAAYAAYYDGVYPWNLQIWGVPTVAGKFNVSFTVTDATGAASTQVFPLVVSKLFTGAAPGGTINVPYSYTFKVQGGAGPYTAQLISGAFPAGLTFNTTTLTLSGTPVENGNANTSYIVLFTDASNPGNTYKLSTGINIASDGTTTISVNSQNLGTATVNAAYSNTLSACCVPTYSWSLLAGSTLPPGLTLSSSGVLSGTPTAVGTYNFVVKAADATNANNFGIRNITLTVTNITAITVTGTGNALVFGNVGTAYSQTLTATGGTGAITWSLLGGSFPSFLPPGLSLDPNTGIISGTPTAGGFFNFTVVATDSAGNTSSRGFNLSIYAAGVLPPLVLNFGPNLGTSVIGTFNQAFSLSASGGSGIYTFSYTPGATKVPGMRFLQGTLVPFGGTQPAYFAGVIATPGVYTVPVRVTDSTGAFIDRTATWTVVNTVFADQSSLPKATINVPYSYTMHPIGGSGSYSVTSTNLPAGLSVSTAGVISGTPTAAGSTSVTLSLTDTTNNITVGFGFTLVVNAFSIDTAAVLPSGAVSTPYSQQLAAANCGTGCTWTVASGGLPSGITLSSSGLLSGTSSAFYNSGFAIQASGSAGTVQKQFALLINFPQPLQITNGVTLNSSIGNTVSTALTASGGQGPYTWSLVSGSLPTGVTIAGPGETLASNLLPGFSYLAGRLIAAGTYNFTIKVADSATTPATATQAITWNVSALSVNYTTFPVTAGGVTTPLVYNTSYSQQILVLGGSGNYTSWTVTFGAFPPGLTLGPTGVLSGTPTNTGTFNNTVTIQVTDDANNTTIAGLFITIASPTGVTVSPGNSDTYTFSVGTSTSQNLIPSGGTGPYTLTALTPLPSGCALESGSTELNNAGTTIPYALVCTIFSVGDSVFTLKATDSLGNIGVRNVTIHVLPASTLTFGLANASIGNAYSQFLPIYDTLTPTIALNPGSFLPAGLSLVGNNVVGTPTGPAGTYGFSVVVTDSSGVPTVITFNLAISSIHIDAPDIIPAQIVIGSTFSYTFTASGGGSTKTWSATGLPSGITLSSTTGILSGTTFSGTNTYRITVTVSDGTSSYVHQFTLFAHLSVAALPSFTLTATAMPDARVGQTYSFAMSPSGGVAPFTFSVATGSTLPPGIKLIQGTSFASYNPGLNTVGLGYLQGIATTAGSYTFDILMTDSVGTQLRRTFTLRVSPVAIATGGLRPITTGVAYTAKLTGLGGTAPYTFTYDPVSIFTDMVPQAATPTGASCLTLGSDGTISGTCTTTGSFSFLATVRDAAGRAYQTTYSYTVGTPGGVMITVDPDPTWQVGQNTNTGTLTLNGSSTYTWSVSQGALPPGMSLVVTPGGTVLAGAPSTPGTYSYTLRATDNADTSGNTYAERNYNANVGPIGPITHRLNTQRPPVARVGTPYNYSIEVTGGIPPYSFATTYLSPLPPGLSLSAGGVISGTPTQIGTYVVTYKVTDSTGKFTVSGTHPIFMTVLPSSGVLPLSVPASSSSSFEPGGHDGTVGVAYAVELDQLVNRTGVAPYTWTLASGSTLPPGLAIIPGSNGVSSYIGGVPTTAGTYTFTLTATDSASQSGNSSVTINISQISSSPDSAPNGVVGTPYSLTLLPSGGVAPYVFTLSTSSDMPPGLSFSTTGTLSGTPTYPGTFVLRLTLTDSAQTPRTFSRLYYITIDAATAGTTGISINPAQIQINYTLTAPAPAPLIVSLNSTSGTVPFNAMVAGIPALSLSSTSGNASATTNLTLNTTGLTAGNYIGVLAVDAPTTGNAFAGIPVSLSVVAAPPCTYTLNPTAGSALAAGGSGVFTVATGSLCTWNATTTDSFITITTGSGTGTGSVSYALTANGGTSPRTGNITVGGQTFPITQFGSSCAFAVNPTTIAATAAGGQAFVQVKATSNTCPWTASSTSNLNPTPASGSGNATVALTIPANTGLTTAVLNATVAGQAVTINQSGINCTVSLSASSAEIGSGGGSGSVNVSTPSGCSYATVNGPSWLTVTSNGAGAGPGPVTLGFSASPNSTTAPRSGSLTIGSQSFLVLQDATSCSVTVDASNLGSPFGTSGGSGSIAITANGSNCAWTASSSTTWATLSPQAGTGNGTVNVTVGSNASSTAGRSATLTVAGQSVGLSQAGTVCTYSLGSSVATVPNTGGNGTVTVGAANACTWSSTPDANATWLTITKSGANGTADVTFNAAPNSSSTPRAGTLTIAGQSFVVNQAATPCTYTATTSTTFNAPASGSTGASFGFSTPATGCSTTATSFSSWVHITSAQPVTTQTGSITYTVDANPAAVTRTGTIQFAGLTYNVTQVAAACNYSLNLYAFLFNNSGGNANILASPSANGCTPTASVDQPFVGVTPLTGPVLNIFTEAFTVSPFVTSVSQVRRATITVGGRTVTIKQTSY
jgi:large repetitive protein